MVFILPEVAEVPMNILWIHFILVMNLIELHHQFMVEWSMLFTKLNHTSKFWI